MNSLKALFSTILAFLGIGVKKLNDSLTDSNRVLLLKNELDNAEMELEESKKSLVPVEAKNLEQQKKISDLSTQLEEIKSNLTKAKADGNTELLAKVLKHYREIEVQYNYQVNIQKQTQANVDSAKALILKHQEDLKRTRLEIDMVASTAQVQEVTAKLENNLAFKNSHVEINKTLEDIKQKQSEFEFTRLAGTNLEKEFDTEGQYAQALKDGGLSKEESDDEALARILGTDKKEGNKNTL